MDCALRSLKNENVFRCCLNVSNFSSGHLNPGARVFHTQGLAAMNLLSRKLLAFSCHSLVMWPYRFCADFVLLLTQFWLYVGEIRLWYMQVACGNFAHFASGTVKSSFCWRQQRGTRLLWLEAGSAICSHPIPSLVSAVYVCGLCICRPVVHCYLIY